MICAVIQLPLQWQLNCSRICLEFKSHLVLGETKEDAAELWIPELEVGEVRLTGEGRGGEGRWEWEAHVFAAI